MIIHHPQAQVSWPQQGPLQGSVAVAKGEKIPVLGGFMATQHWLAEVKWLMLREYFLQDTTAASVPAYDSFPMEEGYGKYLNTWGW